MEIAGLIKGILFDLDNTLIATEAVAEQLLSDILAAFGATLTPAEKKWMVGRRWADIVEQVISPRKIPLSEDAIMTQLLDRKDVLITKTRPFLPGAISALDCLAAHYPIGIVTGSFRREVLFVLRLMGKDADFCPVVSSEDVTRGKPDPEPYQRGARLLHLLPGNILVFEDSSAGIASAKAAGCYCVAVRAGAYPDADLSRADRIIDTLEIVTPDFVSRFAS